MKKVLKDINRFLRFKKTADSSFANLEYAFHSGGVSFYKYKDDLSMPADRAMSAMDIYEELNQRIDREYLQSFFKLLIEKLEKGRLVDASYITKLAQSRLEHITNTQSLMKLATVIYIAEWENPLRFSLEDSDKKIAHWIKHEDVESFFLREPIRKFIPYSESSEWNTMNYLKAQNKEVERILQSNLNTLSDNTENKELKVLLESQLKQVNQLTKFLR